MQPNEFQTRLRETMTKVARGRAYYASPNDLATFVFRDYIRNRKKLFR